MIFEPKVLAPGLGTRAKATFRAAPDKIRFERFTVFQAFDSAGGHALPPPGKRKMRISSRKGRKQAQQIGKKRKRRAS